MRGFGITALWAEVKHSLAGRSALYTTVFVLNAPAHPYIIPDLGMPIEYHQQSGYGKSHFQVLFNSGMNFAMLISLPPTARR
jgi:hypothetical protein